MPYYQNTVFVLLIIVLLNSCKSNRQEVQNDKRSPQRSQRTVEGDSVLKTLLPPDTVITTSTPFIYTVLFLNNEVFVYRKTENDTIQLSITNNSIDAIYVSPLSDYVACLHRVSMVDEPGLWSEGEEVPQTPIHNIEVYNVSTQKVIRSIKPSDMFQTFQKWFTPNRFSLSTGDGFALSGCYAYDAKLDSLVELPYGYLPD